MIPCVKYSDTVFLQKKEMKNEKQLRNSIGCVLLSKRMAMEDDGIKVTQDDVASKAGISTRFYGKIERGESMPSLYVLMKIAESLQMSLGDLSKQIEEY